MGEHVKVHGEYSAHLERIANLEAEVDRVEKSRGYWMRLVHIEQQKRLAAEAKVEQLKKNLDVEGEYSMLCDEQVKELRAKVERLCSFPPCCYDGLGNEGRGCQLLTDAQIENEKLRGVIEGNHYRDYWRNRAAELEAALASLEGEGR